MENVVETGKVAMRDKYLIFFIDDEKYGLSIKKIREIIAPLNITHIPKTPLFVKGVINLRGSIIPIVDLRMKFGMDEHKIDMNTAIIIYEVDEVSIGFMVDEVEDVIILEETQISEAPHFGGSIDTSFITHMAEIDDGVIMLLDLKKIFEAEELLDIEKIEKTEVIS